MKAIVDTLIEGWLELRRLASLCIRKNHHFWGTRMRGLTVTFKINAGAHGCTVNKMKSIINV